MNFSNWDNIAERNASCDLLPMEASRCHNYSITAVLNTGGFTGRFPSKHILICHFHLVKVHNDLLIQIADPLGMLQGASLVNCCNVLPLGAFQVRERILFFSSFFTKMRF